MLQRFLVLIAFLVAGLALPGCDKYGDPLSDTGSDPLDVLIRDLREAGAEAALVGPVSQPFLSGAGNRLTIEGEGVQAFVYDDAAKALAEAGHISPDGAAIEGGDAAHMVLWVAPPHFFRRDRIIVLYLGEQPAVLSVLEKVLGPQFAGR